MSNRHEDIQLNLDQEGIEQAIEFLQMLKTIPQSRRMCALGAHGVNDALNKAIQKLGDAEILYNYYTEGDES